MHFLNKTLQFPDVASSTNDGLVAVGGDLSIERLMLAYKKGIFPWFEAEEPILWWSPDPRFVLFPEKLKVSKSMKQILRNNTFTVTVNKDFNAVIEACAQTKRQGQSSSWITDNMKQAYLEMYALGYAKSVEVWQDEVLVGGLYGVDLGNQVFCGESMFNKVSNASKIGFITFVRQSNYKLIDCQVHTNHLESLGAEDMSRDEFLKSIEG